MTSNELLELFRADIVDTAAPYLWSDAEAYAYMNDAYFMFVRLTGGIPDATSEACTVDAKANEPYADLHPSVLVVRTASLAPRNDTVKVINAQDMENLSDEDWGVLRRVNQSTSIGKVRYMVVGMEQDIVRWVNIPDVDYTVNLMIDRLPLKKITGAGQKFADVKDHHHLHFMKWMKHLAYSKQDAETFNKAKADEQKLAFYEYCDFAKREKERYKHKVRVVRYGGI